ncbi:MAG TPA: mechanosensitive ion channel [Saprospiraceae bacterium]|jgi:small-conductance mechanosensitive channel|nr:mechanosensitive ion channel [Saprospiraceae bacterium]
MMTMETARKNYYISGYAALSVFFLVLYYVTNLPIFKQWEHYLALIQKFTLSLSLISAIFLTGRIIERLIDSRTETEGARHNLIRITRLLTIVFVLIVVVSFLFQNLYAVAISFGLISLVLGFALQAPTTSFIAWLFIIFRKPYQVGDRVQIGTLRGDVIEISYLDTILEEVSGTYLGNDRKSGRLIHFPNSLILTSQVVNYSGPFDDFIWNETAVQISFTSDLTFVEYCLKEAADKDFMEQYPGKPMDDLHAAVYFRVNTFAWLEAVVSYPVEPEDTTGRRNRILKYGLASLNAHPDKVGFPEGTKR